MQWNGASDIAASVSTVMTISSGSSFFKHATAISLNFLLYVRRNTNSNVETWKESLKTKDLMKILMTTLALQLVTSFAKEIQLEVRTDSHLIYI